MKHKASISLVSATVILMALPYGIRIKVFDKPGLIIEPYIAYCSYFSFDLLSVSSNWFPVITVILSIAILYLYIFGVCKKTSQILLLICMVTSLMSWFIHTSLTVIGAAVFCLHLSLFLLQFRFVKSNSGESK